MHEQAPTLTIAAGRGTFRWVIAEPVRAVSQRGRKIMVITAGRDAAVSALAAGRADIAVVAYDPPPAARHGRVITRATLDEIVHAPGKRRFEVRGELIRAAQGHSIPVDLRLTPREPPALLYHGTVARFHPRIRAEGLRPGNRNHVHLSADPATAAEVGARRGRPVVLVIDAAALHRDGQQFYRAANGVWLTSHVPPGQIRAEQ